MPKTVDNGDIYHSRASLARIAIGRLVERPYRYTVLGLTYSTLKVTML